MNAAAVAAPSARPKPERAGIVAVLRDQPTLDRVQGVIRDLQLDDELTLEPSLDAALRGIREGGSPRVLILDLSDSTAPIAELSAARSVGGGELKLLALGTVNDVGLFRDLLAAGASDYMVKPPGREALATGLEKRGNIGPGGPGAGLGQVVAFIGSRGGVGTTTAAVATAWLLADRCNESTALIDLDLYFGTVALGLDTDPGSGLCEALEQPSRIDALFVDRAMVKVSDTLRILAAEASIAETLMIDAGAIDTLLYELRRKFGWVIIDLPRWANPMQRVVLGAANKVVVVCERTLAGLRDTIRLQTMLREHAPQTQVVLVDAGASGERATVGRSEFAKAAGNALDLALPHDSKAAGAAANAGQPLPLASPRSAVVRELEQLIGLLAGSNQPQKRRLFGFPLR